MGCLPPHFCHFLKRAESIRLAQHSNTLHDVRSEICVPLHLCCVIFAFHLCDFMCANLRGGGCLSPHFCPSFEAHRGKSASSALKPST